MAEQSKTATVANVATATVPNRMQELVVEKLVINVGTGSDQHIHANAKRLLELITGRKPSNAVSRKRNPSFKITKGQNIGTFVTVRGPEIKPLAERLFDAVDRQIKETAVTDNCVSFGIREYIDIRGVKYDPKIGMLGMNVNLAFKRKGTRVALRKRKRAAVPRRHRLVDRNDILQYLKRNYNVELAQQPT